MLKFIPYFMVVVLFFLACGGGTTNTSAYITTPEKNNTIAIDRQKQKEIILEQIGDRYRGQMVTAKDNRDIFVLVDSKYDPMGQEIRDYDITKQEPVFKKIIAISSDDDHFIGMYPLSGGKFVYVVSYFMKAGISKYDVKLESEIWHEIVGDDDEYFTPTDLYFDPNGKYIIVGKYKIDISSNYAFPSITCVDGSQKVAGVCK